MADLEPGVILSADTVAAMERLATQPRAAMTEQHRAAPELWAPASSLVERVADAIAAADDEGLTNMTWSNHSRAAILAVAAWFRTERAWPETAAALEQEANR